MPTEIKRIRIHPGIGIARLGNSEEYFIGPEAPGVVADPGGEGGPGHAEGSYRDGDQKLKRQAQRYRIYGYNADGKIIAELNSDSDGVAEIQWRVHVRNMKAANYAFQGAYLFNPDKLRNPSIQPGKPPIERNQLIIDPGVQTIGSKNKEPVILKGDIFGGVEQGTLPGYLKYTNQTPKDPSMEVKVTYTQAKDIELGQLHLDNKQRLLFVPSPGKSECVTTPKIELSNPSEFHSPPNGPDQGEDPLTNQFAYFNVPGWWDDTCGGEIDVTIEFKDGSVLSTRNGVNHLSDEGERNPTAGAWVVTAPPKYSPYMYHVVSILDRVFEAYPEADPNYGKKTNFFRDVYPILSKACNYGWVSAEAGGVDPSTRNLAHGPKQAGNLLSPKNLKAFTNPGKESQAARQQIYAIMRRADGGKLVDTLRPPPPQRPDSYKNMKEKPVARGNKMPKLWGSAGKPLQNQQLGNNFPNQYLSLTDVQLKRMADWAKGDFEPGILETPKPLERLPLDQQPHAMDCAALEPTIGGGFHPGIEFPYLIIYTENFAEAFRVNQHIEPGSVAAYMSSPWQGDYWSCNTAWWPVQRPDIVFDYDDTTKTRTYKQWFRGYDAKGEPLSSTDGYNQMVYAWPKLGMVLPKKDAQGNFVKDNNEIVFEEFERDPSLNKPPKSPG